MLKWPGKIRFIVSIPKNSHGIKWNYGYGVYYLKGAVLYYVESCIERYSFHRKKVFHEDLFFNWSNRGD